MLGAAYEYLIAQFADDAGEKGGEFYTPKMVVRLIGDMLQVNEGMSTYDPACGSGGMLLEAVHQLERKGKNPRSLHLSHDCPIQLWTVRAGISMLHHDH